MSGYHVCCNQYKNSFFNEFSHLQHDEEFVDLTLAADGYLVKVHKNVIAVASPYLKEMLKSSASQSPVIFLNKVNHVILKYIIEYIYQGEVDVPVSFLKEFVEVAKSLHINGINSVDLKQLPKSGQQTIVEPVKNKRLNNIIEGIAAHITINNVNNRHSLEVQKCNEIETINADSDFNDGIEEFEATDYVVENIEHPPENRPIDAVTLPTLNTEENNQISEYLWSKKGSLLQSSSDNIIENSENILIQNVGNPPDDRPIDAVTLQSLNTEENNQLSEYLCSKKGSLLQSSRDNIENNFIQNVGYKGKKLEIVIDGTKATLNVTGTTLNVIENTEDITENIETQNRINYPENDIDYGSASDLKNVNSRNKNVEEENSMDYDISFNTSIQVQQLNENEAGTHLDSLNNIELDKVATDDLRGMAQYTITQRGNTQLILNRYMYCCQFESRRGLRTRWRCVDYRKSRCPAMIEMENEKILKRTGIHGHGFHDNKIYKKHRKGLIFSTLQIAKKAYVDNPTLFVD